MKTKIKVFPHIHSAVDFINHGGGITLNLCDMTQFMPGAVCLDEREIEVDIDHDKLTKMALSSIEQAEEIVKVELQEKLTKLQEEKNKLLAITYQAGE